MEKNYSKNETVLAVSNKDVSTSENKLTEDNLTDSSDINDSREIEKLERIWDELKKLDNFHTKISSEKSAIEYCIELGLVMKKKTCNDCGTDMSYLNDPRLNPPFRFKCRNCRKKMSALKGTWFAFVSIPDMRFSKVLYIIRGFSDHRDVYDMSAVTNLSYPTVQRQYSHLRKICMFAYNSQEKLGGKGKTVDIGESLYGWSKHNINKKHPCWILGGIERESGNFFVEPIKMRTRKDIWFVLISRIKAGTTIVTESLERYQGLGSINDYKHKFFEREKIRQLDDYYQTHIRNMKNLWHDLKVILFNNLSIRPTSIPYFLAEAWVRIICSDNDMFDYMVEMIATFYNGNTNTISNFKNILRKIFKENQDLAANLMENISS